MYQAKKRNGPSASGGGGATKKRRTTAAQTASINDRSAVATAAVNPATTPATDTALNTAELVEGIFSHLGFKDVSQAMQANRFFRNVGRSSPNVKQTRFLQSSNIPPRTYLIDDKKGSLTLLDGPASSPRADKWLSVQTYHVLNPLIDINLKKQAKNNSRKYGCDFKDLDKHSHTGRYIYLPSPVGEDATIRKMLIVQPPATRVQFGPVYYDNFDEEWKEVAARNPKGVTIGDLIDAIASVETLPTYRQKLPGTLFCGFIGSSERGSIVTLDEMEHLKASEGKICPHLQRQRAEQTG